MCWLTLLALFCHLFVCVNDCGRGCGCVCGCVVCVCVCAALVWNVRDDGMAIVTLDRKAVSMGGMLGVVVDAVVAELVVWVVVLCVGGMLGCELCVG